MTGFPALVAIASWCAVQFTIVGTTLAADPPPAGGLTGPYIQERHLTSLRFGTHSHWLQPWRAYQDTVPAQRFLDGLGVCLDHHSETDNPELILEMLAKHGMRHARLDIGWGDVNYSDENRLNHAESLRRVLLACQKHRLRPLIVLYAHHGVPCPVNTFERVLAEKAAKGDRRVALTDVRDLHVGYSGFSDLTDYRAAEVIVTKIEGNTVTLSRPLPKALGDKGAAVKMATLKYLPFSAPETEDYLRTLEGWKRYVGLVARFAAETLGTKGAADLGFDLEIWNELTFGSAFLSINNYYEPKPSEYREDHIVGTLVKETSDYVAGRPSEFAGVTLVDGFRNTIPWPAASLEPLHIGAMSAHPYPPRKRYPADEQAGPSLNALFLDEEETFTPAYTALFPEYYATGLQTEMVVRDMAPITTPIYDKLHGRYARASRGTVLPCPMWITEVGLHPQEHGVVGPDAALGLKARTTARSACFFVSRGVERVYFFSALNGDSGYGIVQDNFRAYAGSHSKYPDDDGPYTSPTLKALGRIAAKMQEGLDPRLGATRKLAVAAITDSHGHAQFRGDGSPEHPDLFNREVFAFLPFQVNAGRFVIPYYVMTRDVTHQLPPEEYTLKIVGVKAEDASFAAYDPIRDAEDPVQVSAATDDEGTIVLRATDYPRLLIIQERTERASPNASGAP